MAKHNSDLFYTCSLIEYIGRERLCYEEGQVCA